MEVQFKNFRCFKDTKPVKLKKITFLVGENSSGKTSFLAGVNHVSKLIQGEEIQSDSIGLNVPPFRLGTFREIVHSGPGEENKKFQYKVKHGKTTCKWRFVNNNQEVNVSRVDLEIPLEDGLLVASIDAERRILKFDANLTEEQMEAFRYFGANVKLSDSHSKDLCVVTIKPISRLMSIMRTVNYDELEKMIEFSTIYNSGKTIQLDSEEPADLKMQSDRAIVHLANLDTLVKFTKQLRRRVLGQGESVFFTSIPIAPLRAEPDRYYSIVNFRLGSSDPSGERFPLRLLRDQSSMSKDAYREILKRVEDFGKNSGLFKRIFIKYWGEDSGHPFSLMVETISGRKSNIIDVGYGVSQILPLIYEILNANYPTQFLIQQPEVHMHPCAQAEFTTFISTMVKEKNCEFVIETHSDFLIDRIRHVIMNEGISNNDVNILFFDSTGDTTRIHQIDLDSEGLPVDPPDSYRKFFLEEFDRVWP